MVSILISELIACSLLLVATHSFFLFTYEDAKTAAGTANDCIVPGLGSRVKNFASFAGEQGKGPALGV
jgi:hypothetical protein